MLWWKVKWWVIKPNNELKINFKIKMKLYNITVTWSYSDTNHLLQWVIVLIELSFPCWQLLLFIPMPFQPRERWGTVASITTSLLCSPCRAWIHREEKKSKREKTPPAGNRMHMALRRMVGWIQEMEREEEEEVILDHSCVRIEKISVLEHRETFCWSFPRP